MSEDILVHHVELSYLRDIPHYVAVVGDGFVSGENGEQFPAFRAKVMPADVFESRAAEYGIDPDSPGGWDDILNLVLAPQGESDRSVAQELDDPDHLWNAPTVEHARKAKLARVRKAMGVRKLRGVTGVSEHRMLIGEATRITESDAEDPLEFIKRTAPMSAEHIAVKAEFVRRTRTNTRARRLGLDPNRAYTPEELEQHEKRRAMKKAPARESAEKLAIKLLGEPMDDVRGDRLPPRPGTPSKYL